MTRTPPRAAHRLLRLFLGSAAFEIVAGDLDEEFTRGRSAAWYWRHAIKSIAAHSMGLVPGALQTIGASMRQLRRQPLYVTAVAGTLALGVATAMASAAVAKRAFVDALPYPHADRLVSLLTYTDGRTSSLAAAVFRDLRESQSPFDLFAPIRPVSPTLTTAEATTTVPATLVTPDYFALVGARPALGHVWSASTNEGVVVSWPFFERELAGDPAAVGRAITLDGAARTVLGVLPAGFHAPYWPRTEVWAPLDLNALARDPRGRRSLTILARRSDTQPEDAVRAFMAQFTARLQSQYPVEHGQQSWIGRPLREEFTGTSGPALVGVAAGAALLLLIVCANIAGLSAARAMGLQHQTAVRQAMGASRARLFGEQLSDSLCLAVAGTALGAACAPLLVRLAAENQREFLDRLAPFSLDATTLALGAATGLFTGIVAALLPARLMGPARLDDMLRSVRGAAGGRRLTFARQGLVVAQVALALVLVIGAGLLVRTVAHLTTMPLGFKTEGMTTLSISMPGARYATEAQQLQLEDDLITRLRQIPGVTGATASVGLPAGAAMGASLHIQGRPVTGGLPEVVYFSADPGFMRQMGIPIRLGRDLSPADTGNTTGAILINESMARLYWPEGNALGARIYLGPGAPEPGDWMEVVGVIADVRQFGPTEDVRPTAFGSTRQYSWPRRYFTVEAPTRPATLVSDLRAAVRAADPAVSIGLMRSLDELLVAQQRRHRLVMFVLILFGSVSLILCGSGLYAVVAMASQLRRREYAIRVALGAARQHVRWQVVRQAAYLAGTGIALGLAIAVGGVRAIQGLLHGVTAVDTATFAAAAALLSLLAAGAAWWPARQASRVDPVDALKAE